MKDKEFFTKTCLPMIASKLRKDVMDYFFLNDTQNLKQYIQPNLYSKLNPLEQILLAFSLKDYNDLRKKTLTYFIKKHETLKVSAKQLDKLLSFFMLFFFRNPCTQ